MRGEYSDASLNGGPNRAGVNCVHVPLAFHGCMPTEVVHKPNNSGKVGVGWCSPVIKNASLPESDADASLSQVDGTARTGQVDTQAHYSRQGPTACVQTGVPLTGILPPVVSDRLTPRERNPRRSRRGGCHRCISHPVIVNYFGSNFIMLVYHSTMSVSEVCSIRFI